RVRAPLVLAAAARADAVDHQLALVEIERQLASEHEAPEGKHRLGEWPVPRQRAEELEGLDGRLAGHHGAQQLLDPRLVGSGEGCDAGCRPGRLHGLTSRVRATETVASEEALALRKT